MDNHKCQLCNKTASRLLHGGLNSYPIPYKKGVEISFELNHYLCEKHYNAFLKAIKGIGVLGAILQSNKK